MSVKVLKLESQKSDNYIIIREEPNDEYVFVSCAAEKGLQITLDRSQAHLLKLWLEEHLK